MLLLENFSNSKCGCDDAELCLLELLHISEVHFLAIFGVVSP